MIDLSYASRNDIEEENKLTGLPQHSGRAATWPELGRRLMHRPAALLVVDMQYGFMANGADRLVPEVRDLVAQYPTDKVYYLRYRNHPGSLFTRYLNWHEFMTSDQSAIVPDVYRAGSRVFDHFGYSPPPEMIDVLKADGLVEIGICGVDTDACVMAALFSLWDHDIRPIVLSSYCFSSGGENLHRAALDMMLRQFGFGSVFPKRFPLGAQA